MHAPSSQIKIAPKNNDQYVLIIYEVEFQKELVRLILYYLKS